MVTRGIFHIISKSATSLVRLVPVTGDIDDAKSIGYFYNSSEQKWVVTDLATGRWAAKVDKYQECLDYAKSNFDRIEERRKKNIYKKSVELFNYLKEQGNKGMESGEIKERFDIEV